MKEKSFFINFLSFFLIFLNFSFAFFSLGGEKTYTGFLFFFIVFLSFIVLFYDKKKFLNFIFLFFLGFFFIEFFFDTEKIFEIHKTFSFYLLNFLFGIFIFFEYKNKIFSFEKNEKNIFSQKKIENSIFPKPSQGLKIFYTIFLTFLFFGLISSIFSDFSSNSFFGNIERNQGFFFYFGIFIFSIFLNFLAFEKEDFKEILKKISLQIFTVLIFVFIFYYLDYFKSNLGRWSSVFGHPVALGQYFVLLYPIIFYFFIEKFEKTKKFFNIYFLLLLLSAIAIFFSSSRMAIFVFLLQSLFGIGFFLKKFYSENFEKMFQFSSKYQNKSIKDKEILQKSSFFSKILKIFLLFGILFFIFYQFGIFSRFESNLENFRSINTRFLIFDAGIKEIGQNLFFGHGFDTQSFFLSKYIDSALIELEGINSVGDRIHNEFLDILFQIGILGALFYFALFFLGFYFCIKNFFEKKDYLFLFLFLALFGNFLTKQVSFAFSSELLFVFFLLFFVYKEKDFSNSEIFSGFNFIFKIFERKLFLKILIFFSLILLFFGGKELYANKLFKNYFYSEEKDFDIIKNIFSYSQKKEYLFFLIISPINPNDKENFFFIKSLLEKNKNLENVSLDFNFYQGIFFENIQDFNLAKNSFEKAIKLGPKNPKNYLEYGKTFFYIKDFEKAKENFEKAISLFPKYFVNENTENDFQKERLRIFLKKDFEILDNARLFLSKSLASLGKFDEAILALEKVKIQDIDLLNTYGIIFFMKGDFEKSLYYNEKMLVLDPNNENIQKSIKILKEKLLYLETEFTE